MLSSLKSLGFRFTRDPLRMILILVTVAAGTTVLILSLNLSLELRMLLREAIPEIGRRVAIANAEIKKDGSIDWQMPPRFREGDGKTLLSEYPNLHFITPIERIPWNRLRVGESLYQPRSVLATGADYAALMDLHMVAGSFFTAEDVEKRNGVMVLSEPAARVLFGSAADAVGKTVSSHLSQTIVRIGPEGPQKDGGLKTITLEETYTVIGVFQAVSSIQREAYAVPEILIPYTAFIPKNSPMIIRTFIAKASRDEAGKVEGDIKGILQQIHGEDTRVSVWEGNPLHPSTYIENTRDSIKRFSTVLSALGVFVLIVSSFGIFSIMMVEILDRGRETAMRRAVGSTRRGIICRLVGQAVYLTLFGAVIGICLAWIFNGLLIQVLVPYLETAGVKPEDITSPGPNLIAAALSVTAAVAAGALFAFFPAFIAARLPVVECLREE
ncbi:MAG: ABC transporter permease [Spirochaetota bacterium]